ncbi:alpha/beta fold hydrolase [Streptomyces alkaliterrae]|uniref:Alpha/beta fold hydrolase n=1 Tax=Streptomyces alkaliterrae TaxID=2213162 RepID=A0A5P0YN19_9ACTN|nr:alpha/beta fold hydrolase [Streptomyces alkaliterrae]MBB1258191.1 alpha/beta fold hydrolase [Streptomyces alkaliterrae]MQS01661.1 alpha/beta fold hydrolase [Streptomyces alkaliterrae]
MGLRLAATRRRLVAGAVALLLLGGAGAATAVVAGSPEPVHRSDQRLTMPDARIDTSFFTTGPSDRRRPAVLLGHGFGGSKNELAEQAEQLARDGYAVLTWSARGFGKSTGRIGLNDPEGEGADVRRLVDWLAKRPEVQLDAEGDPRVGVTGASYAGAAALLAAGQDKRVDAIAPMITYWDLADALFPEGVYKKLWAGVFFTTGSLAPGGDPRGVPGGTGGSGGEDGPGEPPRRGGGNSAERPQTRPADGCGRFQPELCRMYERVAEAGRPDAEARKLLAERSPAAFAERVRVPTLVVHGQSDSLFPLDHGDRIARAVSGNGAPVAVDWIAGGHDGGDTEIDRVRQRVTAWFDRHLRGDESADTGPAFRVSRTGGINSTNGSATLRGASASAYPGLRAGAVDVPLAGPQQTFRNPPGAGPPSLSTIPGLGGGLDQLRSFNVSISQDMPGQFAAFRSEPLDRSLRITGTPTATVHVRASDAAAAARDKGGTEAVLFGKVYDVAPDGRRTLPAQLVSPVRVTGADEGRTVRLRLPAVDHEVKAGHRLELVVASTDLAYASPLRAADYTVSLADPALSVPTAPAVRTDAAAFPWWVWGLPLAGALIALALLLTARRGRGAHGPTEPDPELTDVPLEITGLSKRYAGSADRYAVRDVGFRVEKGQVLGLLGPNGAGKTTTLRMLMGLITPDAGEIRVFGHPVRPGAPVLSRVGAFVEGAGFLPHLSGRANLELYWRATGRPAEDAHVDEALEIADLGEALDRAVRTYSQGMRQRLAIAQAMLGLPDLLILDEPTNGLDPPQIREMREVMIRYAETGRTVIVSSHLLSEVEQSCTHLVVMDRGRLVQAGPVAEITGAGDSLLVGLAGEPDAERLAKYAEQAAAVPGVASAEPAPPPEGGLLLRLDGGSAADVLGALVAAGLPVERFGPNRRLEDAFLTMIGGPSA